MLTARPQNPAVPLDPVMDLATACEWLRTDVGAMAELGVAADLMRSAMARIETMCKQPIFARDYFAFGEGFGLQADLPSLNVLSVTKIEYRLMGSADWVTLDASSYDWTETGELTFYPLAQMITGVSRIRVSYRAGYEPTSVPADIVQAIRLLIGRWYDIRSDEKKEVPSHAEWLIKDYVLPIL
ncbi:head-tail connector protein [Spirosoma agri]|uniref:Phage gp6-like head-tail connector protein n=1 Tax=Spirosoma agri TaxID=1987381 RepID=A0A6M0IJ52_9BACT|nr:head-tail connector protein [Spirosoma agri]NEU68316.1 phage gp6-like head-tail connector protein [Spirosoma agri]